MVILLSPKKGDNSITKFKNTALLSRLSREDELLGDSESITTQKSMLEQYAIRNGFTNIAHYVDDGFSETNFDRPDFIRLVEDVKLGKISTIITKDLSRLGRDYLKTGYYLEEFFPTHNVRFIAINDDVDTSKGIPELTPFKNIMNEWHAKDISKKIRSAYRTKALKGQFTAAYAPYGYKKDFNDRHHLIVDKEAADTVKEIFILASIGRSSFEIANILKDKKILKPRAKVMKDNGKYDNKLWEKHPYDWSPLTIASIIKNEEYLGHIVNNKNTTSSFKSKKLISLPRENWIIVENMHEAIIDKQLFNSANEMITKKKRISKKTKERNMFSGLLMCSICKKALSLYSTDKKWDSFCCVTYRSFGKKYCSAHYIRYEVLYDYVLKEIQSIHRQIKNDKASFITSIMKYTNNDSNISKHKNEIKKLNNRLEVVNVVIKKLYEDYALGKTTEVMYNNLKLTYEIELNEITENVKIINNEILDYKQQENKLIEFIKVISDYDSIEELNIKLLNDFINKIIIHEREIINGKRHQKMTIIFRYMQVGL